jgi:hypothetical protein
MRLSEKSQLLDGWIFKQFDNGVSVNSNQRHPSTEPVSDRFRHNFSKSYLADTFGISRPTLYKYMDLYDCRETEDIPGRVLEFFDYVSERDRTYEEMVGFLDKVAQIHHMEPHAREKDVLQWSSHNIRTVPIVSDGVLTVIFKDALHSPQETVMRINVKVSDENVVIAECSPAPGLHYIRVDGLPANVNMEYVLIQSDRDLRVESEPVKFIIPGE